MEHCCGAHHGLAVGGRVSLVSAIINTSLAIIKLVIGYWSGSKALVADGLHSVMDVSSDAITYLAMRVGRKQADDTHPYGHGKFETFASFALSLTLLATSGYVLWDAALALIDGHSMAEDTSWPALAAAAISVIANEWLFRYSIYHGQKINAQILIVNAWHNRTDSLSGLAVLVGVGMSALGYPAWDAIAAIGVGAFLLYISVKMLRECFDELVEAAPDDEMQHKLQDMAMKIPGVRNVHRLRSRKVGSELVVDLHVEVDNHLSVSEGHQIADRVERLLKEQVPEVSDALVHIDVVGNNYMGTPFSKAEAIAEVERVLKEIAPMVTLDTLHLHLVEEAREVDIILKGSATLVKKVLPQLRAALLFPHGKFDVVNISVKVD